MIKKIILILAIIFSLSVNNAEAEIDRETVKKAWARIAKADGFKIVEIHFEKSKSPNAWVRFKSKNNFSVHVTKGLMKILNSEEEIAGVLGHEIGHVKLGHYEKGVGRSVGWTALSLLIGKTAGGLAQGVSNVGMNLAEKGFSREQEVEADNYGTNLLVKAGYSPWGLYNAMKAFKDNKFVTEPGGFNSHPPTDRRLKHLHDKASKLQKNKK